ncbi:MAG: MarR family winged helix-turn-helix transcriptional regulator [Anaeroplasmataceae bacterium]
MDGRNITKIVRNMMLYKNKKNNNNLNNNEFELVRYTTKHNEGLSLKDIASYLNVDKALVTRMVKKLASENYIEVLSDSTDLRKKIIKPLNLAYSIKETEKNEEIEFYNAIFKVLTKEELDHLDELIYKVYMESKRYRKIKFEGINDEKEGL